MHSPYVCAAHTEGHPRHGPFPWPAHSGHTRARHPDFSDAFWVDAEAARAHYVEAAMHAEPARAHYAMRASRGGY